MFRNLGLCLTSSRLRLLEHHRRQNRDGRQQLTRLREKKKNTVHWKHKAALNSATVGCCAVRRGETVQLFHGSPGRQPAPPAESATLAAPLSQCWNKPYDPSSFLSTWRPALSGLACDKSEETQGRKCPYKPRYDLVFAVPWRLAAFLHRKARNCSLQWRRATLPQRRTERGGKQTERSEVKPNANLACTMPVVWHYWKENMLWPVWWECRKAATWLPKGGSWPCAGQMDLLASAGSTGRAPCQYHEGHLEHYQTAFKTHFVEYVFWNVSRFLSMTSLWSLEAKYTTTWLYADDVIFYITCWAFEVSHEVN